MRKSCLIIQQIMPLYSVCSLFCLWLTLFKNNFIYESKCDANVDVVFLQQSLNVLDAYHYIPINQNLLIATVMHEHLN